MMKKKQRLTYNQILLVLTAALLAVMLGSVILGRYPIGLKELGGILAARLWDLEPFWTKTQESLLLQHRIPAFCWPVWWAEVWPVPEPLIRVCSRIPCHPRIFWVPPPVPPSARPWPSC